MDIHFSQVPPGPGTPAPADQARGNQLAEHRDIVQAVRMVNAAEMLGQDNELSFLMDRETQRPILRIVNRKTKEVVRQVPEEYVLRLARELRRPESE
jgi:flagellar protein FlaG